jgi:hypothetical protein
MLCGVGSEPAVREWACGLVALLRAMQLQIIAGALDDVADTEALQTLGFDGVAVPR